MPRSQNRKQHGVFWLRLVISVAAVALLAAHLLWPEMEVDAATIALVIVAILPWLSSLIESAEFPGGWKIKFRDLEAAGRKIAPEAAPEPAPTLAEEAGLVQLDPNLALVGLRIEIEKRLRGIARQYDLDDRKPLMRLFRDLQSRQILNVPVLGGLQEVVAAGNRAAHGAEVEDEVAAWALDYGPRILAVLDAYLT